MGKTALITGASSGLGAEYARQLAESADVIVLVARDKKALEAVADEVRARGARAEIVVADLTHPRQRARVEERLRSHDRPIDVLVNNAGLGLPLNFARVSIEDEAAHLQLHVETPMRLMHAVLPVMQRRGGRIINVASISAFIPRSTYGAVKAWVVSFSRWANAFYDGVSVTAVCPGYTHTNFHERLGLPPGQEGVPSWMWLDAPTVVRESLRDASRGKAVSIPSARYKAIAFVARFAPDTLPTRLGSRGR